MTKTIRTKKMLPTITAFAGLVCFSLLLGCGGDGGTGTLTVLLEAEDTITDGLEEGTGGENIQDGWNVSFDKYIVAIGDIDVHLSTDEEVEMDNEDVFVVDLTDVPAAGLSLWTLEDLEEGTWEFNYSTPIATDSAIRHNSVTQADYDQMVANGWTYFIDGTLQKTSGRSLPPNRPGGSRWHAHTRWYQWGW